ncbi:hypothetical protein [Bdellovibrio sp. HCB337]|uniref:hypothetical protein n=1 Tax=Bdellovibrio sp. HCB337 TaxID=3394358 RepID=UPI0039A74D5A
MYLILLASVFILGPLGVLAAPDLCKTPEKDPYLCKPLTPQQEFAKQQCELELKTANCDLWYEKNPTAAVNGRSCTTLAVCPTPTSLSDFTTTCSAEVWQANVDFAAAIIEFVATDIKKTPEMKAREEYFNKCKTAECKKEMLGPYVGLFTKEEIEGHPFDRNVRDPNDPANANYLNGLSAETLYRKLLVKLKKQAADKTLDAPFVEPWSENEAVSLKPHSVNEMIDGVLADMGIANSVCYDPVVVAKMRCYALAIVLDPFVATKGITAISKLAGLTEKAVNGVKAGRSIVQAKTARAPMKPEVITIDDIGKIQKKDPESLEAALDLKEIRAQSGRMGQKHVGTLPELKGSLKEAFDGPIEQQKFKPGQVLWQVQRSKQANGGRWFSTDVAKNRDEAEDLFNVATWGNDRGQMRMYVVKEEFTGYVGKVAGGKGNQLFIPDKIPIEEVAAPFSYRTVAGGGEIKDLTTIKKGTPIEITFPADGNSRFHIERVEFIGLRRAGKYTVITYGTRSGGITSLPLELEDLSKITVREISEKHLETLSQVYAPGDHSPNIMRNYMDVVKKSPDKNNNLQAERLRGQWVSGRGRGDDPYVFKTSEGKTVTVKAGEVDWGHTYEIDKDQYLTSPAQLKHNEKLVSHLYPGERIQLTSLEKDAQGQLKSHEFTGEFKGMDKNYLILQRPGDLAPIYVRKHEVVNQKVKVLKKAPSNFVPVNPKQRKFFRDSIDVEVTYIDKQGKIQKLNGQLSNYDTYEVERLVPDELQIYTYDSNTIRIPYDAVLPDGIRLRKVNVVNP